MNFNYKTEAEQQIFVRNKKLTWAFHVLFTIILQTMLVKNVSEELHKDDLYKQLEFGDQNYEVRVEYHRFLRCINFYFQKLFQFTSSMDFIFKSPHCQSGFNTLPSHE